MSISFMSGANSMREKPNYKQGFFAMGPRAHVPKSSDKTGFSGVWISAFGAFPKTLLAL
jgi:hypothetical protein